MGESLAHVGESRKCVACNDTLPHRLWDPPSTENEVTVGRLGKHQPEGTCLQYQLILHVDVDGISLGRPADSEANLGQLKELY